MMICSRRLYKGNSYEICLPLPDSGVTMVRFYTGKDIFIEKEPEISGDSMCFSFTKEELDPLADGVLRYEVVTEYETIDTNSPFVVVTPEDYDAKSLDEIIEEAYQSGYTEGYADGYVDGQSECHHDYSKDYFTIEALEDGQLNVRSVGSNLYYSINDGEWEAVVPDQNLNYSINLDNGDKVRFKGENYSTVQKMFSMNYFAYIVYGNIMSLNYGDNFENETTIYEAFDWLFDGSTGLTDASNLILPADTLVPDCYLYMFRGCTSLTAAPELPATTLARNCYRSMFDGCTNLTTAPEIPATTLAFACYYMMFKGCTSLTEAPELPSTNLAEGCYGAMFEGCTNLTTAPELPATVLAEDCYSGMFKGCTSLTETPALPATTMATGCYAFMFSGCTSITIAPELTAPILVERCYNRMFYGCTNLNYIKCLATDMSANLCTSVWVQGVSPFGDFIRKYGSNWPIGESGIPSGWRVADVDMPL